MIITYKGGKAFQFEGSNNDLYMQAKYNMPEITLEEYKAIKAKNPKGAKGEDALQIQVVEYLQKNYNDILWFHCPNGGSRNKIEAAKLKRMGVRAGVADLLIFKTFNFNYCSIPAKVLSYYGLAIELKFGKNKPTKYQIKFSEDINKAGWLYCVCYTFEQVKEILDTYICKQSTTQP